MAKHPNYELFEEIGRGENSIVYRAWDLLLNRDVAVKELKSATGSDAGRSDVERTDEFLKEAGFLAQFEHENVLRIHTVDQERAWIVMELMKGSLASQIANKPMPADTVRSVVRQTLVALDFLHAKGKVHGSVRPSNILINEEGIAKLSDFEASNRDSELRVPAGSKKYLAPELIRSEFGEFGEAVDLYCLGFTALELLTGSKFDSLFPGTGEGAIDADVAWMRWHSSDEPMKPIKEILPSVPNDLATVIDQLLKKPVVERPDSAAAVLKLLDESPFIPVQVIAPVTKPTKQDDVAAILPSKAVKLREPVRKKKSNKQAAATPATGKDKLNEVLGKPYVLWPVCIGILIAATFTGLALRGDGSEKPSSIADNGNPEIVQPIAESEPQPLSVTINILPDANDATLTVAGEIRDLNNLRLKPGQYEIVVQKDGFETFKSPLKINADNTAFDVLLEATQPEVAVVDVSQPKFLEIAVSVSPPDAKLIINDGDLELQDGMLRFELVEDFQLQMLAQADGYESKQQHWSVDQLQELDQGLQLSLEKLPVIEQKFGLTLPSSMIPKPGTPLDQETGLPIRTLAQARSIR